jgi:hypothetical protein
LHEALFLEGRYSDKVLMGVTAEQFFKARVSAAANSE